MERWFNMTGIRSKFVLFLAGCAVKPSRPLYARTEKIENSPPRNYAAVTH
jgi:hypothetical protein